MNTLTRLLTYSYRVDLRPDAERAVSAAARADIERNRDAAPPAPITIRRAGPDEDAALIRLAALDSSRVPDRPILVAEADGEVRAALCLADGATVADPFHPTVAIIELLETWRSATEPNRVSVLRRGLRHVFSRRTLRDR